MRVHPRRCPCSLTPQPHTPRAAAVLPTLGALVLVQLIRQGGTSSPSYVIGYWLSNWLGSFFLIISAFLGALGSFFSVRCAVTCAVVFCFQPCVHSLGSVGEGAVACAAVVQAWF